LEKNTFEVPLFITKLYFILFSLHNKIIVSKDMYDELRDIGGFFITTLPKALKAFYLFYLFFL